jgi:DNA-binding NtrC family response regulator
MRRVHALAIEHLDATDFSAIGESSASNKPSNTSVDLEAVKSAGSMKAMVEELEKRWISEALETFDGHRGDVCQSLGIPKTTLYAKMKRYGISTENAD